MSRRHETILLESDSGRRKSTLLGRHDNDIGFEQHSLDIPFKTISKFGITAVSVAVA